MGFLSNIVSSAKKVLKATAPITTAVSTFGTAGAFGGLAAGSLSSVATRAITSRLPTSLAKIATPAISSAATRLFGRARVGQPITPPGGSLVSATQARKAITAGVTPVPAGALSQRIQAATAASRARAGFSSATIGQLFSPSTTRAPTVTRSPLVASSGGSGMGGGPGGGLPIIAGGMSSGRQLARTAGMALPAMVLGGAIRSVTGRIIAFVGANGRRFPRKKVVDLAKRFGPEAAAAAVGASLPDIYQAIVDDSGTRRRRRGITPRDLQTTRRTICKIKNMNKLITGRAPTRRTCK